MNAVNAGVSFGLMVAVGIALMWAQTRTVSGRVDAILVRLSGAAFAGAGVVGAAGWLGSAMSSVLGWLISTINSISTNLVGEGVAVLIVLGIGALWVGAMLPDKVFKHDPPDWLLYSGVVLPGLLGSVPGPLGHGLESIIHWAGAGMAGLVGQVL